MQESNNTMPLSRPVALFFKTVAVLSLFPFLVLSALSRIQHNMPSEWFNNHANSLATLSVLVFIAFIGADASKKSGYGNLEAVHGIIGGIVAAMIVFKLIPSIFLALTISVLLVPIMYMLIRRIPPNELTRKPRAGESEITVLSFLMGKHKKSK